ncbi:MAG: hypothetical protein U1F52_10255 [Burkholderiales bacterium]
MRTTPETLTELRRVLAAVDTPPRLLEISVAQDVDAVLLQEGAVLDERAARIFSSRSAAGQTGIQVLRVYEGAVASTVTDVVPVAPAVTVVPGPSRRRAIPVPTTPPSSTSGFEARARVHGDRVSVEVSNVGRRLSPRAGGTVETQVLETVIHGRLGEWLPVGGTGRVRDADTDAIRYRSGDAARDIRRTWIKVDLVPEDTRDAR